MVWEALSEAWVGSGGPGEEGWEGSGDPSKDLGGAWTDKRDWEALPEGQKGSGGSPRGLGGVESPY